ncbi:hypothetical protein AB6D72_09795 [Vibrio alginolyticus]|uniref:hypothetical protein n=1 Tax=Vibrio TaxID=662 RepID=UPI001CDC71D4|nr:MULTISPECIES: hypothetical protein [Vibrio]MCA2451629.1 hypothetical protein [Vibrio alginolyticus]MCA2475446.1 hypothetical protein [Vibrio alginolyticus]MCS0286621.1 hypothetical protein [Vibrio alginolyticus]MDW2155475.1 hypothetical protein [Vibrio sp. 2092]MDW2231633.1 hypothetical protein [Vibrio sp. 2091]
MSTEVMSRETFNYILIAVEYFAILLMGIFIVRKRKMLKGEKSILERMPKLKKPALMLVFLLLFVL